MIGTLVAAAAGTFIGQAIFHATAGAIAWWCARRRERAHLLMVAKVLFGLEPRKGESIKALRARCRELLRSGGQQGGLSS